MVRRARIRQAALALAVIGGSAATVVAASGAAAGAQATNPEAVELHASPGPTPALGLHGRLHGQAVPAAAPAAVGLTAGVAAGEGSAAQPPAESNGTGGEALGLVAVVVFFAVATIRRLRRAT